MPRVLMAAAIVVAILIGALIWQLGRQPDATSPTNEARPMRSPDVADVTASGSGTALAPSKSTDSKSTDDRSPDSVPRGRPDPDPNPEGVEASPEVLAAFRAGAAKLRKASADCVRELVEPKTGAVQIAVDIELASKTAQAKKIEVLDRGNQTEAFDACMVNELADESWPADLPNGKLTFEFSFELAELGR